MISLENGKRDTPAFLRLNSMPSEDSIFWAYRMKYNGLSDKPFIITLNYFHSIGTQGCCHNKTYIPSKLKRVPAENWTGIE